jgi:hypothetical protein
LRIRHYYKSSKVEAADIQQSEYRLCQSRIALMGKHESGNLQIIISIASKALTVLRLSVSTNHQLEQMSG